MRLQVAFHDMVLWHSMPQPRKAVQSYKHIPKAGFLTQSSSDKIVATVHGKL
ncbi:MAG: hypothetical protein IH810_01155 [Proteobacteria bacterium]|nr:hypothetical protein [Pseudomonadota bacterium]